MGAGKSTAAREVGAALGLEVLDADAVLEDRLGEPIEAFFDREGEAAFRAREEQAVLELLGRGGGAAIALGGGALGSERVREALCAHVAVLVEIGVDEAWERAAGRGRPLARDREAFAELYARRAPVYEMAARAVLPRGDRGVPARAASALAALAGAPAGTRLLWARSASGEYP
ncbi:MAG TPA: shikimate kinase, partial [Solirubrobacteraceae bacterium]|nr:shikimate kinase [Solirubrobacteraceae bacterium]